jgi:hypothetical protein
VPLGEGEVDHPEHRRQASRPLVRVRNAQSDASVTDLPFCADNPLGDRRLSEQQQPCYRGDRQTRHDAQSERDARCRVERRVAAGEQQLELVIAGDDGAVRLARSPVLRGFALLPDTGITA